jgi:hypothetical protein
MTNDTQTRPGYLQIRSVAPATYDEFRAEATRRRITLAQLMSDVWATYKIVRDDPKIASRRAA